MEHFFDTEEHLIEELSKLGISGKYLYLVELFPLIEMIWADGINQTKEIEIFYKAVDTVVDQINSHADHEIFTNSEARTFLSPFLASKPSDTILSLLKQLYVTTLNKVEDPERKKKMVNSFLAYSLDIASSCVASYPYENDGRFDYAEKMCFFSILQDMNMGSFHLSD